MTGAFTGKMMKSMLMISVLPVIICFFIFTGVFSFNHLFQSVTDGDALKYCNHTTQSGYRNEINFYNKSLAHGEFNRQKGLIQYRNNWTEPPRENDIIAFDGKDGTIAVISNIGDGFVEVEQQNTYVKSCETLKLTIQNGVYFIGDDDHKPLGWMRVP